MRAGIKWKLMISYLALVVLIGLGIYGYLSHSLRLHLTDEIRDNLVNEARLVRMMATGEIRVLARDALPLARNAGGEIKARVSVITDRGVVVGDSELSDAGIRGMENHADRPEFRQAMAGGTGVAMRYSATLRTQMMYVALPFRAASGERGVIRLALPLSRLDAAISGMHAMLAAALVFAVIFSLFLSFLFSSLISGPLRAMAGVAARIGRGEFSCRIPVAGRDEVGELAAVMNEMAEKIEVQLERLSAEKNRLDAILRGMGEGVIVTDENGVVTLSNPAFRRLFSVGELPDGLSLLEITRQPAMNATMRKVLATREDTVEEIAVQVPEERHLLVHWVPLVEEGTLLGAVAVFHDISDLKALERIRRDFVANVSHELRTPVSVIKGYAETLSGEGGNLSPEQSAHFAGIINRHAERLSNLINDLLTLSRIESGAMSLEPVPVSLEEAVAQAVRFMEQKAHAKGITLVAADLRNRELQVLADPVRLEQVLVNLLDNAVKFTPADGVITISARDLGPQVRVDVSDTGCGIPSRDLLRIFERFYRVDAARSRDLGGTGLGLAIVRHIVQAHGGTVAVESTPGRGSTFSFTLRKA